MKRILRHLLVLLLLATPAAVQAQFSTSTNNGTITITGYTGPGGNITIPSTTNGYPVVYIANYAFDGNSNITSVIVSSGVTNVGAFAFGYCTNLGSATVPGTVPVLFGDEFWGCDVLTNVVLSEGVEELGPATFLGCGSLTNITFPASITFIGDDAFAYTAYAPVSMYFLGDAPYIIEDAVPGGGCSVYYLPCNSGWSNWPANLTGIVAQPWWQAVLTWATNDGTITITGSLDLGGLTNLTLPASLDDLPVTEIAPGAFAGSISNISTIIFPNSITKVGANAFANCPTLTGVYFNSNAPSGVDPTAFSGDTNAVVCYFEGTSNWSATLGGLPTLQQTAVTDFTYSIFDNKDISFPYTGQVSISGYTGPSGDVVIPAYINGLPVTTLANFAFNNSSNLVALTVPSSIANIGALALFSCQNLTAINVGPLGSGMSSVNAVLFNGNQTTLLQYPAALVGEFYTIPNAVTTIGPFSFCGCRALVSVIIPASVTNIQAGAFYNCISMQSAYFEGNAPNLSSEFTSGGEGFEYPPFENDSGSTFYFLPGMTGWSNNYGGQPTAMVTPPAQFTATSSGGGVTITGYSGSSNSLIIPFAINGAPVTSIAANAFSGLDNLTSVILPTTVASIEADAFVGCFGLSNVTIPSAVTNIGDNAFANCTALTAVYFEGSAPGIGSGVFSGDSSAVIYYSPCGSGWTAYFAGLSAIPATAPSLFSYESYANGLAIAGYSGTCGDVILPSFVNGLPVVDVWYFAFGFPGGVPLLTNLTIPASITNIGELAFTECMNLKAIYFEGNLPPAGWTEFSGDKATAYYLPGTTGWSNFASLTGDSVPPVLWDPQIQTSGTNFGVRSNQFGFNVTAPTNLSVVVAACTNLANPLWVPLTNVTLANGSFYFSDPQWSKCPTRYYHLQMP